MVVEEEDISVYRKDDSKQVQEDFLMKREANAHTLNCAFGKKKLHFARNALRKGKQTPSKKEKSSKNKNPKCHLDREKAIESLFTV